MTFSHAEVNTYPNILTRLAWLVIFLFCFVCFEINRAQRQWNKK